MRATFQDRVTQLKSVIKNYSMAVNPALIQLAERGMDLKTAHYLVHQYYSVNLAFPLFLAAAIAKVLDEKSRLLLVGNLCEEHGNLDSSKTHTELFRVFIRALKVNPAHVNTVTESSPANKLITHYNTLCFSGAEHQALAALYAFETLLTPACELISRSLRKSRIVAEEAIVFFDVHAVVDIGHASQLEEALLKTVDSAQKWEEALTSVDQSGKLLYEVFDSIAKHHYQVG